MGKKWLFCYFAILLFFYFSIFLFLEYSSTLYTVYYTCTTRYRAEYNIAILQYVLEYQYGHTGVESNIAIQYNSMLLIPVACYCNIAIPIWIHTGTDIIAIACSIVACRWAWFMAGFARSIVRYHIHTFYIPVHTCHMHVACHFLPRYCTEWVGFVE